MKKHFIWLLAIFFVLTLISGTAAAYSTNKTEAPKVKCYNGVFVGSEENGIASFKGIPYAKPPVGELRWKAPQSVEASNETFDATKFGKAALQPKAHSEPVSMHPENMSEDCLTLNVWTTGKSDKKKPVMFWLHGGAYSFSGSREALYDGSHIVAAHPEVVVVTINYRLGPIGFLDLSGVKGGENFPTSGYNGILDQIEALKWVQQNIEAFGGDPQNVTIFGESAGGGSVSCLLVAKGTEGLFRRVIAQSGALNFSYTHENFDRYGAANVLLEKANATCMTDLMKLSEKELFDLYLDKSNGVSLSEFNYAPLRGDDSIIPADPYQAMLNGAGKDIDLMIGSTTDEYRFFIYDTLNPSKTEEKTTISEKTKETFSDIMLDSSVNILLKMCSEVEKANIDKFMSMHKDKEAFWQKIELMNEVSFREPAIQMATNHVKAGGKGKTYMYYFCKENTSYDWIGASHGCELPYVFHNLEKEQVADFGPFIPELADQVNGAWVSFAVWGNPTYGGVEWPEYSLVNRETMFFNNDGTTSVVNDPLPEERELLSQILHHYKGL